MYSENCDNGISHDRRKIPFRQDFVLPYIVIRYSPRIDQERFPLKVGLIFTDITVLSKLRKILN